MFSIGKETPEEAIVCDPGSGITLDSITREPTCAICQRTTFNVNGDGTCYPCPAGAICPGGDSVLAQFGYWQDPFLAHTEPKLFLCSGYIYSAFILV